VKKPETTNPELIALIRFLKKQSKENEALIWKDIAEDLTKPRRSRIAVNLSHLNRYTEKNEIVIVPGKVLGAGEIDHPITVAAFSFSNRGRTKIQTARGKIISLTDLVRKNPKGSNVRIIG